MRSVRDRTFWPFPHSNRTFYQFPHFATLFVYFRICFAYFCIFRIISHIFGIKTKSWTSENPKTACAEMLQNVLDCCKMSWRAKSLKDQVLQNVLDCCKMSWVVAKCPVLLQNVLGCLLVDLQSVDQLKSCAVFCYRLCSSLMDRFVKRVAPGSFC